MDVLGASQNEVVRPARRWVSYGVLFHRLKDERVIPAEMKVLGWRKGERHGMVVRGAVRVGGHVPWGAKAEYAFRTGYDGRGRMSVTHVVERDTPPC